MCMYRITCRAAIMFVDLSEKNTALQAEYHPFSPYACEFEGQKTISYDGVERKGRPHHGWQQGYWIRNCRIAIGAGTESGHNGTFQRACRSSAKEAVGKR